MKISTSCSGLRAGAHAKSYLKPHCYSTTVSSHFNLTSFTNLFVHIGGPGLRLQWKFNVFPGELWSILFLL